MGMCAEHPLCAVPGDGVCPSCLQKKLNHVWRGESYSDVVVAEAVSTSMPTYQPSSVDPIHPKEAIAIIGSIASIAKRHHSKQSTGRAGDVTELASAESMVLDRKPSRKPHPSFDVRDGVSRGDTLTDAKPFTPRKQSQDIESVMKDWTELHAKRRSQGATVGKKKSVTIADDSPMVEYSRAGLPLVDRIAKETALRVIREVGDDISVEEEPSSANRQPEDDSWDDNILLKSMKQQEKSSFLSPVHWHSRIRSKWVKGLGSPLTSSSKVFPSKSVENVQKSQAQFGSARSDSRVKKSRLKKSVDQRKAPSFNVEQARELPTAIPHSKVAYDAEFSSDTVIEGMPDQILKPEDMNQRLRTSYNTVLSWLQDLPCPPTQLFQQPGEPEDSSLPSSLVTESPRNNDIYDEDLTLVGHLHEIAEEHEDYEESSEEEVSTANHLSEVSSFGKFLIRAAQRQPREGLSRVASATSAR